MAGEISELPPDAQKRGSKRIGRRDMLAYRASRVFASRKLLYPCFGEISYSNLTRAVAVMLMLAPVAGAHLPGEEPNTTVIEWWQFLHDAASVAEWNGDEITITLDRPHNYELVNSTARLAYSGSVAMSAGVGTGLRIFHIELNGTELQPCAMVITTGGGSIESGARGTSHGGISCSTKTGSIERFNFSSPNTFRFTNTGSGGTISHVAMTVYLIITDEVIMSHENHILETLEAFGPLIIGFLVLLIARQDSIPVMRYAWWSIAVVAMGTWLAAPLEPFSALISLVVLIILGLVARSILEAYADIQEKEEINNG